MQQLKSLYEKITNLGVTSNLKIEEVQRVRLTNILGTFPIFVYLYFIYFGISTNYFFPPILCTGLTIGAITGLYFNYKCRYSLAKGILFSVNSFSVFAAYNVLNIDYSITCYFFPLVIAYEIVFDVKKEFKQFLPTFIFTLTCILACFLLPKYLLYGYQMTDELLRTSIILNYIFPMLLSVAFMFTIINIHSKTQDKLIKAREESERANKAKTDFLSNMSHELRTPLNGIIGSANLLMHEPATLSQKKYYDILHHSSDHMLNLINHILDFSKINEGKINLDRNTFNFKHVLSKLSRVYQAQNVNEALTFDFTIDERLDKNFISDDLRLKQILVNLLSNAFKFTKKGAVSLNAFVISEDTDAMTIRFSVKDSGVGIKDEQLKKIFESFEQADNSTTRNFGGTGLGLSICKELVKLFNSQLHVDSIYGEGSEFYFTIKAELDKTALIDETKEVAIVKDLMGLKMLVAEDNAVNMLVLRTFLKKWNISFDEAVNGSDALQHFIKNDYDVVLLDLEMPIMDGYTTIKEIRKRDTKTPVVAFTAALYDGMQNDLIGKGFNEYLHKPFNPNDLYNKIAKYKL
jgi:signal transduction histidine kinase/CheY-like chemotaxis protein